MLRATNRVRELHMLRSRFLQQLQRSQNSRAFASLASLHDDLKIGDLKVGDNVSGFSVKQVHNIPRLDLTAIDLIHEQSKARHLHVARDDNNNVFSVGFKTNPPDHTGLPHILEHLTLCGSHKYPVKDPFFKMLTRSLANFMNAMTGCDYTYYPFATTNHKDFKNLQSVYLDSVYSPLLRPDDFSQEGWRLEHEDPLDQSSPIIFKGVVFNEMKGQLSNPSYLFYIKYIQSIYPSLQCSGGDPKFITSLKYDDLKQFHDTRYHPSNSFSFSYGNMDLREILNPMKKYLEELSGKPATTDKAVHEPITLKENTSVSMFGPNDPMLDPSKQHKVSLSWIVGDSADIDSYSWSVLSLLLTNGHSSPFHKALIDSGLGPQFSVNTGLDSQPAKNIFSIGLDGISEDTIPKFKEAVFSVLEDVAKNGVPKEHLQAILNQVELSNREVQPQFGLELTHRLFPRVFNDPKAIELIDSEKRLDLFKQRFQENPRLFQNLVQDQLLNKPYFEFIMKPSDSFEQELAEDESKRLEAAVSSLSAEEKQQVFLKAKELVESEDKQKQEEEQLISTLPTLSSEDISPEARHFPVVRTNIGPVEWMYRETGTQGLAYVSILNDLHNIPAELRPLLPLYSDSLTSLGTRKHAMDELEQLIRLNTGGVSASVFAKAESVLDPENTQLLLSLGGTAVDDKMGVVYEVLQEMLHDLKYDNLDKLKQLIQGSVSNSTDVLSSSGHRFAMGHAASTVTKTARLKETLNGIEQLQYLKEVSLMDDDALVAEIVPKLQQIGSFASVLRNTKASLTFTPGDGVQESHRAKLGAFVESLDFEASTTNEQSSPELENVQLSSVKKNIFQMPFQISYVGAALKGASYLDADSAALSLLADLLTHKYMHPEVRERGGAYGGGASYSAIDGTFSFYSYRDPNPRNTLSVIEKSGEWASVEDRFSERNLLEAKLSIFQRLDQPLSPRAEIDSEFVYGLTGEMRQARRSALLAVTLSDIKRVAEKYLVGSLKDASRTIVGPAPDVDRDGWSVVDFGADKEQEQ